MSHEPAQPHERLHYPTNRVFAIIDEPGDADAAVAALVAAGFAQDQIEVYRGEDQAHRADAPQGMMARLQHMLTTGGEEQEYVARHREALLAGATLVGVLAPDAAAKQQIRDVLHANGGYFINFYGAWGIEMLHS